VKRLEWTLALLALTFGSTLAEAAGGCGRCGGGGQTYTYNGSQGSYSSGQTYAQPPSYAPQPVAYAPQPAYTQPQAPAYGAYQTAGQVPPAAAQPSPFRMLRRR